MEIKKPKSEEKGQSSQKVTEGNANHANKGKILLYCFITLIGIGGLFVVFQPPKPLPVKGGIIPFGRYYADPNYSYTKSAINWRVLEVREDKVLLLSVLGLETRYYQNNSKRVTWDQCYLRDYLNNDFYRIAFDDKEQSQIIRMTQSGRGGKRALDDRNQGNVLYVEECNDTEDKVFILSVEEVMKYLPIGERRMKNTHYIRNKHGIGIDSCTPSPNSDINPPDYSYGFWWLRDVNVESQPDSELDNTSGFNIGPDGTIGGFGQMDSAGYVVRPAIWVKLDAFK